MEKKPYHHGNLKNALIEAGLSIVSAEGERQLSLRKTAAMCGVSHAAPYAHFADKEELLSAMKEYVTRKFTEALQESIRDNPMDSSAPVRLGKAYVLFFYRNPHYFSFLFSQPDIEVSLNLQEDSGRNYPPFAQLQETVRQVFGGMGCPPERQEQLVIAMWALAHGLASISTMKNVRYDKNWEVELEAILTVFSAPQGAEGSKNAKTFYPV